MQRQSSTTHALPRGFQHGALAALAFACAAAPLPFPIHAGSAPIVLEWKPSPGAKIVRNFTIEHKLVMLSMSFETNGSVQDSQDRLDIDSAATLRITDELRALEAGRPTLLQRSFKDVSYVANLNVPVGSSSTQIDKFVAKSPLNGLSVLYTWVEAEKGYGKLYDDKEGTEEHLLRLSEDLDLRALLPGKAVEPGESWQIPCEQLTDMFVPGGRIPLRFEEKKSVDRYQRTLEAGVGGSLFEIFGGTPKGGIKATLRKIEEREGQRLAHVDLDADLGQDRDQTAFAQSGVTGADLAAFGNVNSARTVWSFQGKGELIWDLGRARASSLDLRGSQEVENQIEFGRGGEAKPTRQKVKMGGAFVLKAEFTGT